MTKTLSIALLVAVALATSGCEHMTTQQQRAISGAAIGAGAGLAISALAGGSLLGGALIGGAGGAVIGAVTK